MSDDESSPLLSAATPKRNADTHEPSQSGETTPLLSGTTATPRYDGDLDEPDHDAVSIRSVQPVPSQPVPNKKQPRRWASFFAMLILGILVVVIIIAAFIVPDAVQEYAQQAAVLEPTSLSVDSITTDGVNARVQANFWLDASRVESDYVRRVGQATTWFANQLQTDTTEVAVALPDYSDMILGTTVIPPLVINLRDGVTTSFDFVAALKPGKVEGLRQIANDWLQGRLDILRLRGMTNLSLRSGLIPLGTHAIAETIVFEAKKIPAMPAYNITRLNVKDVPSPGNRTSMVADVSLDAYNSYPVELTVPEIAFEILVPGCSNEPYIIIADAVTSEFQVKPRANVEVNVHGLIHKLPDSLTRDCPDTGSSPLDLLLSQYMHGEPATLFVRGSSVPDGSTPQWIAQILSSVTLPVPFPGRSLDGLLRNFSLTDVHFSLPDSEAEPGDPASNPKVSGNVLVTAGLPSEMNFGINVTKVRAFADVIYNTKKLGELNLDEWQDANSTRVEAKDGQEATLKIQSFINQAPLNVTDGDVFSEVVQKLLFGGTQVQLDIDASVDIKVETVLGQLILKKVPAQGKIPVKPLPFGKGSLADLAPEVGSVRILDTTWSSITLQAHVNATNPTPYTAHVPYVNIHVLSNGSVLGEATVENLDIRQGVNSDILVTATWDPMMGGSEGRYIGRTLISQYLSGFNTSITIKAHEHSIPGQPILGKALSRFNFTFPTPKLELPGDTPDEKSHFIRDATFHIFSSTATFTLVSPLHYNTLYIDFVNATALYNHTHPIGHILHNLPFEAPPGSSQTPRLPVQWSVGSVGYDAVRGALGGRLKLDAKADLDIRLGNWKESLWYEGKGIGAGVAL